MIAGFLQHVRPTGFKRIHHVGLLAPAAKAERLAAARALLAVLAANPVATEPSARVHGVPAGRGAGPVQRVGGPPARRTSAVLTSAARETGAHPLPPGLGRVAQHLR